MSREDGGLQGRWLRQRREDAGLSQEELAGRSGLSVRTVSSLERGSTRAPHPRTIRLLGEALGLPGKACDELIAVYRASSRGGPVAISPELPQLAGTAGPVVPRELPGLVRHFVGREDDLAALSALADQAPGRASGPVVISAICGTAGVGKTALALQWAHQIAGRFPDGQLYVNLSSPAGITGSGLVRASSTVKNTRTCSARPANRRSHPRTVDAGRPSPAATFRNPAPAAAASSAAPVTAPASARRDKSYTGSSTCVPPHPRHRAPPRHQQLIRPGQQPHPPRPRTPPPAQHPAAQRALQLSLCQLPFDYTPVTVYREHDASKRQLSGPPQSFAKRSRGGPRLIRLAHHAGTQPPVPYPQHQ
jgi:transcriptional regulator with XRE-family HTH domain